MAKKQRKSGLNVSVIGLGYVGLPLALICKEKGHNVVGIDIDERKVRAISSGVCPVKCEKEVAQQVRKLKLSATTKFDSVSESDVVVICVPTPIDKKYNPDLKPLESACRGILPYLSKKQGQLVIVESTINPGVCEDVVLPILEETGLKVGFDIELAHCPERIDPGSAKWSVRNIPRNLGATTKRGLKRGLEFYRSVIEAEINPMETIKEAESTKIIENTFRDINIAYVNELAESFDKMGINISNVIKGASTKPFGFMPFYPGCGIGGHCIPVDPYYLIEYARKNGFDHKFLKLAREINNGMPAYSVELLTKMLNGLGKPLKGTVVGVYGLAFKPEIDDVRESPAYEVIHLLEKMHARVIKYDPFVPQDSDVKSLEELIEKADVLFVATAHNQIKQMDPNLLRKLGTLAVLDGRNCLNRDAIMKLGVAYKGIGK
jgi:UDP-N-acetyl-D-glucosamine dehydrogenase